MTEPCEYHQKLMEALSDIKVAAAQTVIDVLWIKRATYGIFLIALAVFACFYNLDKRVTNCEANVIPRQNQEINQLREQVSNSQEWNKK